MAKEMLFEDACGVTHADSYWRPVQINLAPGVNQAAVLFHGYASKSARDALKNPVGSVQFDVNPDRYGSYFAADKLAEKDPLAMAYKLADETAVKDGKSFFDGAKDA